MAHHLGVCIGLFEKHMKNHLPKEAERSDDIYVELEWRITEFEMMELIKKYSGSELTAQTNNLVDFEPVLAFLRNHWDRINGTRADRIESPNSYANNLCMHVAHKLAKINSGKPAIREEEGLAYFMMSDRINDLTDDQKAEKLKTACAANILKTCKSSSDVVSLLVNDISPQDWELFVSNFDLETMKELFMGSGYIKSKKNIYDAITDCASDDVIYGDDPKKNAAMLYCMIAIYKAQRLSDPEYLSLFPSLGVAIGGHRRVSQASALQAFIVSDATDLDVFLASRPNDKKSIESLAVTTHMSRLVKLARTIKTYVPADFNQRPRATMTGS